MNAAATFEFFATDGVVKRRRRVADRQCMVEQTEPWRERGDWASGRLGSDTGGRVTIASLWLFALVWNAITVLVTLEALRGNVERNLGLAPVFALIGLAILTLATRVTIGQRKWGRSELELQTLPGVLGGPLRCVLHAAPALARAATLDVRIDCFGPKPMIGRVGLFKHRWHYRECIPGNRFELGQQTRVPLAFRLPYALPESDPKRVGDDATWLLRIRAKLPGAHYDACFELPVFRTSESSSEEEGSRVEAPSLVWPHGSARVAALPGSKIRIRNRRTSGREIVFGALRNPWLGLIGVASALFFFGAALVIRYAEGPFVFAWVFAFVAMLLAAVSLDTLFGITRVRVEQGSIQVRHGLFGFGPTRTLSIHEIQRIHVIPEAQPGIPMAFRILIERAHAEVQPRKRAGRADLAAGRHIPTQAEAEAIAQALRDTLGMQRRP